jgi:hypothetical protein
MYHLQVTERRLRQAVDEVREPAAVPVEVEAVCGVDTQSAGAGQRRRDGEQP